ncbi:hypothetical protein MSG28_007178 [Choristoneura fumiferana]|uniref:Uncharacterized protein n=1 Tax=Choristoneura fumiferana TaxID=7141 RepID=A0ACC0JMS6_CHOFU|nr:hypothetical protein MSG28_007178 [Choristoneura fumiferana]
MDVYKHFVAGVRNVMLSTVYVILREEDISLKLLNYVKFLNEVKYEDGMYHTYYGEIKTLVDSFVNYWTDTVDETMKESDRVIHVADKKTIMDLIQYTISVRTAKCKFFQKIFMPIESPEEQTLYDDLMKKHESHMEKMYEMQSEVEKLYKKEQFDAFLKAICPVSVTKINEVFEFAHTYISMLLADHLPEISGSMKEIVQRLHNNLLRLQDECEHGLNSLLHQLYDKHKEQLVLSRREPSSSIEAAEIEKSISKIRSQVIQHSHDTPISLLRHEELYFQERMDEFDLIATTLRKLKAELEDVQREQALYNSMITTELPGSKQQCWQNMAKTYAERKEFAKVNLIKAAKALVTFFCVQGPKWMLYEDAVGPYHIDEYGHQVYHFDSGLKTYHVDCDRNFQEVTDTCLHSYDDKGRYVMKDGEKIYQVMTCTSSYKLGEDTLLKKVTVDCGHSDAFKPNCGMLIKDLSDVEMLPKTEPMDITSTLDSEVVRYLWGAVGGALPPALRDVAALQPKNPIHTWRISAARLQVSTLFSYK